MVLPTADFYGNIQKKKTGTTQQNALNQAMPTLTASASGMQNTIGPTTLLDTILLDTIIGTGFGLSGGQDTYGSGTSFKTPGGGNLSYNTPFWDQIMQAIQDYTSGISDKTGAIEGAINQQQSGLNDLFQQIIGMTGTNVDPQYQQYADQIYNAQKSGLQNLYGTQLGNMTNQALSGLADRGVINSSAFGSAMTDVNQSLSQTLGNQLTQLEMAYPQMAMQLRNEDRSALSSAYGAGTQNLGTYSGAANQTFGNWSNAQSGLMSELMSGLIERSIAQLEYQQELALMRQKTQEEIKLATAKQNLEQRLNEFVNRNNELASKGFHYRNKWPGTW